MDLPLRADCLKTYYPAYHESGQRAPGDVWWIVLHDEEADTARSAAAYFTSSKSGGSAHLCVDADECYRCLSNTTIPWGAASSFGANTHGFHIEQAGYAKWSSIIWTSHLGTLKRAAYKAAQHCVVLGIPPVFIDAAGLLVGKHGITTHAEVTAASKIQDPENAWKYTHTDPGLFWPRSMFMWFVRRYYTQMTA